MKKLKIKEKVKEFNEWKESPDIKRKRMIVFFIFYIFFFIFLFWYIRSFNSENEVVEIEEDVMYKTDKLENNNYSYLYTIEENDNNYTFSGIKDDNNYDLSEYKYKELVNLYTIKRIIKNSKYLLKVEDGNGLINYKYEITNTLLAEILNVNSNIENDVNPIIIYIDKDKNVYQIDCDYSNFMKAINEYEKYKITIKYGEVKNEESSIN